MDSVKNLLGALYSGDKKGAEENFNAALSDKISQAVDVKKVSVAADIFNVRNVKG